MFVRTYTSPHLDANCYVVYNDKMAFVIDPCVSYEVIKKDLKAPLIGIFITHGHYDHFYALESFLKNTKDDVPIYLHKNAIEKLKSSRLNYSYIEYNDLEFNCDSRYKTVEEGEMIINDIKINIIETFGHTNCSITILIDDLLFTGDFLFKDSIGRTDLYSGDNLTMNLSLRKIKTLEILKKYDDYYLYPGHGEMSSLNHEFKYNYYLKN